ncbi:LysE family translocator [Oleisolibacter albus]|uniref:LysE family translocator n=1 Tax=Oleisolibacter albus TaxID=2171757 RepID=UPI000DF33720|nr:LysE family translocator [Oleisolibacter albus]
MTAHTLGLFLVTCFFLSMTPGPNMLLALGLGLRFGLRGAAWAGLGMCLALAGLALLSALGLGAVLAASPLAFQLLKWAGVAYLAWLGVQAWRAPADGARAGAPTPGASADAGRLGEAEGGSVRLLLRGLLVAVSNPKALVFMAALFPQFIDPARPVAPQLGVLVVSMLVIEFGWIMTYAASGDRLAVRLSGAVAMTWLNRVTGSLLLAAGGLLALASHP